MALATRVSRLLLLVLLLTLTAGAYSEGLNKGRTRDKLTGFHEDVLRGLQDSSVWENNKEKLRPGIKAMSDWPVRAANQDGCKESDEGVMTCNGHSVKTVPQNLNKTIVNLLFMRTGVQTLPDGIFEIYNSLESIEFSDNKLSEIAKGAFRGLSNLTYLWFSDNELVDTSFGNETFEGLSSLQILNLDNNNLTRLPTHLIANATNLNYLSMDMNDVSEIGPHSLPSLMGLKFLTMTDNNLTLIDISAFQQTPNLGAVDFTNNRLGAVPTEALNHLPALSQLFLGGNDISFLQSRDLEGPFTNYLLYLDLSNNNLNNVSTSAFMNLHQMKELSLVNCNLTYLNGDEFMYKPHLQRLSIYQNPFMCDCHAAWMVKALEQGKVWAKEWQAVFCGAPKWLLYKSIVDLYPQDLTCARPYIQARTPTYVSIPDTPYFTLELQALMIGGQAFSTWVFPDGSTIKGIRFSMEQSNRWSYAVDTVNDSDHSVIANLSVFGLDTTGVVNITLVASNVAGDSNLTFWVHTEPPSGAGGGPPVYTGTLLLMLMYTMVITG